MSDNIAAIIRENEILRSVASAAIRLRFIGKEMDNHDQSLDELWKADPEMPRSLTGTLMFKQAFETALKNFDDAVEDAAAKGFDWTRENKLGPALVLGAPAP